KEIEIVLAGSTSRGTNLKGDRDFDVFMLFPKSYSEKELAALGLKWAKKVVKGKKWELAYAQHPYLRAWVDGREIDIVPSYKISKISEKATAVDRTPLHAAYILSHITEEQKDDVRLLKQFLKGAGIYGAEGKIQGFSGYLCELLILAYGSFIRFVQEIACLKEIPIFDPEGKRPRELLIKLFPEAAMIYIDPVDSNRNVAAAVSKTSLSLLIYTSRKFLKQPSEKFFFPTSEKFDRKWMEKQLKGRDSEIITIEFECPKVVEDIRWPQLYKFAHKISERAKDNKFSIFDSDVSEKGEKCIILFEFEVYRLPRIKKIVGPPLWYETDVEEFMRKHKVTEPIWFENDRILALDKRKFTRAWDLLKDIIKNPKSYGVPPDILTNMRSARLLDIKDIKKKYPEFLFAYLKKRNI
ncbi:MAG: CCA tRNA nucleotidyltransferase, partial [Candidatus Micrarchaeia archaeon]